MTLLVTQAALMMTVQDAGRFGFRRYGMPESGPMDWWAHQCANILVGNQPGWGCVEVGVSSASIISETDALLAICGAGFKVFVNNRSIPLWMSFWVNRGDHIIFQKEPAGQWVYLAVKGGVQSPLWMGSRSVYPRAGLGCRVEQGDRLPINPRSNPTRAEAGRNIPIEVRPDYKVDPIIRAVSGPHNDRFANQSISDFFSLPFSLSTDFDRMGYRLSGLKLNHTTGANLISQGMALGEVQVPPDGQPIVMMPDHPTTGGYTCIATVARIDLPLLVQSEPMQSKIKFEPIDVQKAQEDLRECVDRLGSAVQEEDDIWDQY
jgi:biotin-dependent carboxylase-like uncharacterized protein